jgi:short-subunit dehydrogenase
VTARLAAITGASSGIGQALAARYYRAGWRLALVARRARQIEEWVVARGFDRSRIAVYAADVRQVDSLVEVGRACIAAHGAPDVVIAGAGISIGFDTAEHDLEVMRRIYETNVLGMAATFHAFLPAMRTRGTGTLVGIGSMAGIRGLPGHGAYCSSKAAVISYCEALRGECRAHGVRVVTINPGYVATPLTAKNRYPMPFLLDPDVFAERAYRAIESGTSYCVIPWQMAVLAKLLRLLPDPLFDRLLAGRPRKHREEAPQ